MGVGVQLELLIADRQRETGTIHDKLRTALVETSLPSVRSRPQQQCTAVNNSRYVGRPAVQSTSKFNARLWPTTNLISQYTS